MAILSFDMEEGAIDRYSEDGSMLRYHLLFGDGSGWLHCERSLQYVRRIREIHPEEAADLWAFLVRGGAAAEFERRMSPEDWAVLSGAQRAAASTAA